MTKKQGGLPLHHISAKSDTGIFFKHTADWQREGSIDFPHRDDYYMFTLLIEGVADAAVDFRDVTLHGGEGIVIVPGQVHFSKFSGSHPLAWCLFVSPDHLTESQRQQLTRYSLNTVPMKFSEKYVDDITRLFELLRGRSDNAEFARAMVTAIVTLFCDAVMPSDSGGSDRYASIVLRLKCLMDKHLTEEKSPAAYASMLNISGVYLNEAVKAVTGTSVSDFIRGQVTVNAKRQLMHTNRNVREIAASLGYDDYSYFTRLFKKATGMTPTDFRKNLE